MDLVNGNRQPMEFPSDELQMERIRAGALGRTVDMYPQQPVEQPQQVEQITPSVTSEELARLRSIDSMVQSGELRSSNTPNDTAMHQPQPETQEPAQDQSKQTDWMAQFDDAFTTNDTQTQVPTAPQDNSIDTRGGTVQNELSDPEVALVNEGAKLGITRDAMIDFARGLTTDDYMELYKYKQDKAANTQQPVQTPSQTPGYQPKNFIRTKPNQGPSVANLNGAPKGQVTGNGTPVLYGTGAMNYNI